MNIIFRNATVAFLLTVAMVLINHLLGWNSVNHSTGEFARHGVTAVFWCAVFLTVVQTRAAAGVDHSFINGFRNGSLFSVSYSALFALFMAFYQHVVNPDFYPTYRRFFENRLKTANLGSELIAIKLRQFDMNYNGEFPSYVLLFLYMAMGGVIMAAIAAVMFRNPRKHA